MLNKSFCDDVISVNILKQFNNTQNLIAVINSVHMLPHSEYLLPVLVQNSFFEQGQSRDMLAESLPLIDKQLYLVARAIVHIPVTGKFLLPLLNHTPRKYTLRAGKIVGFLTRTDQNMVLAPWITPPLSPIAHKTPLPFSTYFDNHTVKISKS